MKRLSECLESLIVIAEVVMRRPARQTVTPWPPGFAYVADEIRRVQQGRGMVGDSHESMVAFLPLASGREQIMLGGVAVGEIGPTHGLRGRFPVCFRLDLPGASSRAWQPACDAADARRQAIGKINDWLNAAALRSNGS
jgi:hypothetical protein